MKAVWLAATLAVVAITYAPQLGAPFELQDDHRIVAPLVRPHAGAMAAYVAEIRSDFTFAGRFRPVNQIFDVIGPVVLGPRPLVWHVVSLLLALAVAALLFHAGTRVWSPAAGAVLALITLLAPDPGPTAAWYRLGPKEAWGMLFLAAALAVMVARRSEVLAFVLVALAAYSKESFLLLVPALFGVRMWLEMRAGTEFRAAVSRLRLVAVAYALLFGVGMAGVFVAIRMAGDQSYGGQSLAITPADIARVLMRDTLRAPLLAAGFVPFALALFSRRPRLFAVLVFLAWIGPQYALHATRGGFWDHYWLPCVVAFAAANAWAVSVLGKRGRILAFAVLALWTVNAMRIDIVAVRNHREKARVQQEAVRVAAAHLTPDADLAIVHDPATQSETAPAFADFVRARGARYRRAILHPAGAPLPDAAVIVHLDQTPASARAGYERLRVGGRREYLSLRERGWTIIPFGLDLDVKRRDA